MKRHRLIAIVTALVLALVGAACGDDDGGTVPQSGARPDPTVTDDTAGDDAFPVTVDADNGAVTIDARPEAIVSLSPTGTEMLFAIGAGDQVVAVDEYSYYPEEAPVTDLSGFQPNLEAIADYEPDLVLITTDPGDVADGLGQLGITVIHLDGALSLDDVYRQIEVLGAATGNLGNAAELVAQMQADIDEIVAGLPDVDRQLTYFHELDNTFYTVTSNTFVGGIYGLLGLVSIADDAEGAAASDFPQISEEFILAADPDLIFLADAQFGETAEVVAARPGWGTLSAVTNGNVVELDGDLASRWGPRIVDHLRAVADAVAVAVG